MNDHDIELREDARDEFFTALAALATEKEIAANGPNPPNVWRSIDAVTLTMNEILIAKGKEWKRDRKREPVHTASLMNGGETYWFFSLDGESYIEVPSDPRLIPFATLQGWWEPKPWRGLLTSRYFLRAYGTEFFEP